jgi:hypothetical protein
MLGLMEKCWLGIWSLGDGNRPTSTPATTGVFINLNIPRSLKNSIQYLAPSPTSTSYP